MMKKFMGAIAVCMAALLGGCSNEGPVKNGETVLIDFAGFLGEEQFAGGTAENYPLTLGSHTFIPGFEEQLVGAKLGESRDVHVTFPADYPAENLAGKDVVFKVTVKGVVR